MAKTTPLDALNPRVPRVSAEIKDQRMAVCNSCDRLHAGICGVCHCVMRIKTTLAPAECPIGKWSAVE